MKKFQAFLPLAIFFYGIGALWLFAWENPFLTYNSVVRGVPFSDAADWEGLAADIARGYGMRGAWGGQRPLYPFLLATFYTWTGPSLLIPKLLNCFMLGVSGVLLFLIAVRVVPVLAAALLPILFFSDPELLRYSPQSLSEPMGVFLFLCSSLLTIQGIEKGSLSRLAWAGAAVAACNLTRTLTILGVPAIALSITAAFVWHKQGWRRALLGGASFTLACLIVLFPWLVRMKMKYGIWTISDTAALSLFAATTETYKTFSPDIDKDMRSMGIPSSIAERYRFFTERFKQNLKSNPEVFLSNAGGAMEYYFSSLGRSAQGYLVLWPVVLLICIVDVFRFTKREDYLFAMLAYGTMSWLFLEVVLYRTYLLLVLSLLGLFFRDSRKSVALLFLNLLCCGVALSLVNESRNARYLIMTNWIFGVLAFSAIYSLVRIMRRDRGQESEKTPIPYAGSLLTKPLLAMSVLFLVASTTRILLISTLSSAPPTEQLHILNGREREDFLQQAFARYPAYFEPFQPLPLQTDVSFAEDHLNHGSWIVAQGTLSRFAYFFPRGTEVRHWARVFQLRPYSRTIYLLNSLYALIPGSLPPEWEGRPVFLFARMNVDTNYAYNDSRTILESALLIPSDSNAQPDWDQAILADNPEHLKVLAKIRS